MPISSAFCAPSAAHQLDVPPDGAVFLIFISSDDPETQQPWCPDVRASWPHVVAAFGADTAPELSVVRVGQRAEWRSEGNAYRRNWGVRGVPTLAKYRRVDGQVVETARLDENGIQDGEALREFLK
ncbi:uncharacterized protein UV8b_08027 [Ustilaginoidea virens]|uniref:Thioredoxin domain-containing protein n=1 Tax=Ustilaginoidea virens TaxID=1159556 RepID=A0A1B5KTE3_USTVR|nr:uncharacterized protein UV8b_08027 [Ustilaginoidea virens]QUC23786.1 hypothetical protein UV8b_08027 [Ustilaginoidea virens]GAO14181.1 hypothetical protein UVI_02001840 [Ustilaginoidea virens]